jgi:hypothetical protein
MADATGPPATQQGSSAAQEKAGQVGESMHEAAGQAQEKATEVTGKAQGMLHDQVDQRSTQAGEKVAETADDLRSVGEELRKQGKEGPAKLADRAAERSEQLGSYLRQSNSDKLLADVEDVGRRQPLAVLAGGLVVGIAAARFMKASSRGRYQSRTSSRGPSQQLGTPIPSRPPEPAVTPAAPRQPVAPGATPPVEPVAGR